MHEFAANVTLNGQTVTKPAHLHRRRTRTSGFRARKLTVGGRRVIKNRRKRGRHVLCPANNYKKRS